jgi:predicted HTH domain antitoxin
MSTITISLPDEVLAALETGRSDVGVELRRAAAVKLYEIGRLSAGAAALVAGLSEPEFLAQLADYGVDTFRLTEDELKAEARLVPHS